MKVANALRVEPTNRWIRHSAVVLVRSDGLSRTLLKPFEARLARLIASLCFPFPEGGLTTCSSAEGERTNRPPIS